MALKNGGKHYLAPELWNLARSVPHVHRVECFAGSLAFTLAADPEGYSEVVCDLHRGLTNFWRVLQNEALFAKFQRRVEAIPFSEEEYRWASSFPEPRNGQYGAATIEDSVFWAANFFVHCRQSLAGRMDHFAPLTRNRVRRQMNEQASAWLTTVEGLSTVHARLKRVVVLSPAPATRIIQQQDGPNTLIYADPPYLDSTRASPKVYQHEMSKHDHCDLLDLLAQVQGKFLLSGYDNQLYREYEQRYGWNRHVFDLPNNSAGGSSKERKTEVVWCNF